MYSAHRWWKRVSSLVCLLTDVYALVFLGARIDLFFVEIFLNVITNVIPRRITVRMSITLKKVLICRKWIFTHGLSKP